MIFKAILDATPTAAVRLNPDFPPKLEDIISKCLEKDRNLRYQHASDIRIDLQRLERDTESKAAIASVSGSSVAPPLLHRAAWRRLTILALLIAIGIGLWIWRTRMQRPLQSMPRYPRHTPDREWKGCPGGHFSRWALYRLQPSLMANNRVCECAMSRPKAMYKFYPRKL